MTLEVMQHSYGSNSTMTSTPYWLMSIMNPLQHLPKQKIHCFRSQPTSFPENVIDKICFLIMKSKFSLCRIHH